MHSDQIGIVGAGNAGWHLATGLHQAGYEIDQIISKNALHAHQLADRVEARYTDSLATLNPDLNFLFLAIPDASIVEVVDQLRDFRGVVLHTSGSFPISGFAGQSYEYGVFYPLQTFSKERPVLWKEIPIFIEACSEKVLGRIKTVASAISDHVLSMDSAQRMKLHLAAVWANNFSNHMLVQAFRILEQNHISPECLVPLIRETFQKALELGPDRAQTGPAERNDRKTLEKHSELLIYDAELKSLYELISQSIHHIASEKKSK